MSVTFATSVWEKDWEFLLKTDRLETAIARCHYPFEEKLLLITNVKNPKLVTSYAETMVERGVIDRFVYVDQHAQAALASLGITPESAAKGYYYSIADYVSIFLCRTKYLLQFKGDSMVAPDAPEDWLTKGVETLERNPAIKVFNLCWNHEYDAAKKEAMSEDENCFIGYGFSDQMYLVRAEEFKGQIYGETHPASERYPSYGGIAFERRVDSWMHNHEYLRATYKHGSYLHQNFPRHWLQRKIRLAMLQLKSRG